MKKSLENGFAYRDLNRNGRLDIYEDARRTVDERVDDLLAQLTLAEKAGLMFHPITGMELDSVGNPNHGLLGSAAFGQ